MAFLQSEQPREPFLHAPPSVLWLIGLMVLIHLVVTVLQVPEQTLVAFELVPARYSQGADWFGLLVPPISHIFLHGSFGHLIINCLWLLAFGPIIARRYGTLYFFSFFLLSGLAGAAAQVAVHWGSTNAALGASAAIAGLMAAGLRLLRLPGTPESSGPRLAAITSPNVLWFTALWLVTNIGIELLGLDIAGAAHIGGYVFGLFAVEAVEQLHLARARRRQRA